jgi:hypothetical protein
MRIYGNKAEVAGVAALAIRSVGGFDKNCPKALRFKAENSSTSLRRIEIILADIHGISVFDPGCSLIPGVGSSSLFSNSGRGVKLSVKILAGAMVLSAVGACPPHDGVR